MTQLKEKKIKFSRPRTNAWWYLDGEWVWVPKGTIFYWSLDLKKDDISTRQLDKALLNT